MFGSKDQDQKASAFAERIRWSQYGRRRRAISLIRYSCTTIAALFFLQIPARAGSLNIFLSTAAPSGLLADLLANLTSQYVATAVPTPYFAGSYNVTLFKKNPNYLPPQISSPILTSTAVDECFAHGFVFGMEDERKDDLRILAGLQEDIFLTDTCGGLISGATMTADIFLEGCRTAYNVAKSTITQRDGLYPVVILGPQTFK